MNFRIKVIQQIIAINEQMLFYPKLKKFYTTHLKNEKLVILDVGCNKGQSVNFFLNINKCSIIYAFEPNKWLFDQLKQEYKSNTNIKLHNVGVSNQNGKLTFNENVMDETSTFETLNYDSAYLKKKAKVLGVSPKNLIVKNYEVNVITLSSFIEEKNITKIDVLKIDVEGHEYACLQGLFSNPAIGKNIEFIQLESHKDDMYFNKKEENEINELLLDNGFQEFEKIKHGFGDIYEIIYKNVNLQK